jgi:chromosome segregation ATPase
MWTSFTNGKVSNLDFAHALLCRFVKFLYSDVSRFSVTGRVEILEATVKSLEGQLEEQSSEADNAITQWQESYTALEVRSSELESQLEMVSGGHSSTALEFEELRSGKERLNKQLRDANEALSAANENLDQDVDVVHEWEGE